MYTYKIYILYQCIILLSNKTKYMIDILLYLIKKNFKIFIITSYIIFFRFFLNFLMSFDQFSFHRYFVSEYLLIFPDIF